MRPPHAHPLKRNDRCWTPHLVAFFDTEFPRDPTRPGSPQMFKCACAAKARRHATGRRPQTESLQTASAPELIDWVERSAEPGTPLWLYGHNVAVDVHSAGLLDGLLDHGWTLSRHGLANPSMWALLVRGRQSIHLCDSMSLFGVGEKRLGQLLGLPKLEMPGYGDHIEDWFAYCWRDVEIGMRALLECMQDWHDHDCGRWTDTGPGCGWNSLRHKIRGGDIWINPDPDAQAFERSAIYGGRRELFRFGDLPESEYADLDLEHAFTSVGEHFALPSSRGRAFEQVQLDSPLIGGAGVGLIARCRVRVETPRYPLRTPAGVVYPIGEFDTILAGPEIADARARGELLSVGPGYGYVLKHWAHEWSKWVAAVLDGRDESVGPMLRQLLKGASKTVWGRTAMRVTGTVSEGDGPTQELRLERGHDQVSGCGLVIIDQGWRRRIEMQDQEGDDSFPAILAWVQSVVRVLVGRLVDAVGTDAVVQVATDGVLVAPWRLAEIVHDAAAPIEGMGDTADLAMAACMVLSHDMDPLRVRLKDVLHRVRALSPDVVESEEGRKISGVPWSAQRKGPWVYQGEVWPTFVTLTQASISGAVVVQPRQWDVSRVRPLRWVYVDGCCEALRATETAGSGGGSSWKPPPVVCGHGAALRADQHPGLTAGS